MKKLVFILAIVAIYGLSISKVNAGVETSGKSKVTVVTNNNTPDDKKADSGKSDVKTETTDTGKKADAKCETKSEGTGCAKAKEAGCGQAKSCCAQKEPAPASDKK